MNPGTGQQRSGNNGSRDALPREVSRLQQRLATLDIPERDELLGMMSAIENTMRRRNRILAMVQEALSQLRLDVKYLMFDLDVTRAERDALQQQVDQQRFDI